jgi:hypothetical protein
MAREESQTGYSDERWTLSLFVIEAREIRTFTILGMEGNPNSIKQNRSPHVNRFKTP